MSFIKRFRTEISMVLFYLFVAIVFTYPLIFKMSQVVWGYSGDNFGGIWQAWWLKYAKEHNLAADFTPLVNAPFGYKLDLITNLEPLWQLPLYHLSQFINEVFIFNSMVFFSFPLAGMTTYLLVKHVTKNNISAFVAGLIYMLAPYHFWQSYVHLSLGLIQWLPLYLLALIRLDEKPNIRNSIFTAVSFALVFLTSWYHGYFIILLTFCFIFSKILYQFLVQRKSYLTLNRIKSYLVTLIVVVALVSPFFLQLLQRSQHQGEDPIKRYGRSMEQLLGLSLRPWDFLIPPPDHFLFGKFETEIHVKIRSLTNDYKSISAFLPERVIYIGWITLILSILGVYWGIRGQSSLAEQDKKVQREFVVVILMTTFLIFLISLPPFIYVKGVKLLLPSYFLYQYLPVFRVYARLGIIILLLLLPLSGLGLSFLLSRVKKVSNKYLITGLVGAVVLFEFWNFPPFHVSDFSNVPDSYKWLADQEGSPIIIEYPKNYDVPDILMYQRIHKKPFFNLAGDISGESKYNVIWSLIEEPLSPTTMPTLAALGIKYAVVHKEVPYDKRNPFDELNFTRTVPPGIITPLRAGGNDHKVAKEFDDALVVEVIAKPEPLLVVDDNEIKAFPKEDYEWRLARKENILSLSNVTKKEKQVNLSFEFSAIDPEDVKTTVKEAGSFVWGERETKSEYSFILKPGLYMIKFEVPKEGLNAKVKNIKVSLSNR